MLETKKWVRPLAAKVGASVYQTLINQMPPHSTYIEAFAGGGAVLRHKRPAALNVAIDRDGGALRNLAVWGLGEWGSGIRDWGRPTGNTSTRLSASVSSWSTIAVTGGEGLLSLVHGDCLPWLLSRDRARDEMLYADPPYVMGTRFAGRAYYEFEYSDPDHVDLLAVLRSLPCRVMVSGYRSELYGDLLADWRVIRFPTVDRDGNLRAERAWMN